MWILWGKILKTIIMNHITEDYKEDFTINGKGKLGRDLFQRLSFSYNYLSQFFSLLISFFLDYKFSFFFRWFFLFSFFCYLSTIIFGDFTILFLLFLVSFANLFDYFVFSNFLLFTRGFFFHNLDLNKITSLLRKREIILNGKIFNIEKISRFKVSVRDNDPFSDVSGIIKVFDFDDKNNFFNLYFYSRVPKSIIYKFVYSELSIFIDGLVFSYSSNFSFFKTIEGLSIIFIIIISLLSSIFSLFGKDFENFVSNSARISVLNEEEEITKDLRRSIDIKSSFDDFKGKEEIKINMMKIADTLKNNSIDLPGMIIWGPPGTGKTLLASSFAKYIDSDFVAKSGLDFNLNIISRSSAEASSNYLRKIFEKINNYAKKNGKKKIVLFIDEMEKMGISGSLGNIIQNSSKGKGGNELIGILDGIDGRKFDRVFLIATANDIGWFSNALLRGNRLNIFKLDTPNYSELSSIFDYKIINEFIPSWRKREFNFQIDLLNNKIVDCKGRFIVDKTVNFLRILISHINTKWGRNFIYKEVNATDGNVFTGADIKELLGNFEKSFAFYIDNETYLEIKDIKEKEKKVNLMKNNIIEIFCWNFVLKVSEDIKRNITILDIEQKNFLESNLKHFIGDPNNLFANIFDADNIMNINGELNEAKAKEFIKRCIYESINED